MSQREPLTIDQNVNFIFHIYSGVYEQMDLKQVDTQVLAHVPRCIWDVECDHYAVCLHNILWRQFATSVMQHILRYRDIFLIDNQDLVNLDALDLAVWFGFNSNVTEVITSMYCGLTTAELIQAVQYNHTEMFDLFAKYIKRIPSND